MKRMTPEQLKAWRDHYRPRDEAFHKAKLQGKDLIRWKFQRYAKNYLRCVKEWTKVSTVSKSNL